eukprot:2009285-Pleurochrysis_carterae.AAC.3
MPTKSCMQRHISKAISETLADGERGLRHGRAYHHLENFATLNSRMDPLAKLQGNRYLMTAVWKLCCPLVDTKCSASAIAAIIWKRMLNWKILMMALFLVAALFQHDCGEIGQLGT